MSTYERLQQQEQDLRQLGQALSDRLSTSEMQRIQAICDGIMAERGRLRHNREAAWHRACAASIENTLPATW